MLSPNLANTCEDQNSNQFPVNFVTFLRTSFWQNNSRWLFLVLPMSFYFVIYMRLSITRIYKTQKKKSKHCLWVLRRILLLHCKFSILLLSYKKLLIVASFRTSLARCWNTLLKKRHVYDTIKHLWWCFSAKIMNVL